MLNLRLLSFVDLCLRVLTTDIACWRIHCLAGDVYITENETPHAAMTNIQTNLFQLFGHLWPAMATQTET
jgi:hypothetical protein